jgi:hypothetical protein
VLPTAGRWICRPSISPRRVECYSWQGTLVLLQRMNGLRTIDWRQQGSPLALGSREVDALLSHLSHRHHQRQVNQLIVISGRKEAPSAEIRPPTA